MEPAEIARMVREHFEPEPVEVLRPNLDTVRWFAEVSGLMQSKMAPTGRLIYLGADWTQIESRRRLSRRRVTPEMIEGLDIMAAAYCQSLNKRSP